MGRVKGIHKEWGETRTSRKPLPPSGLKRRRGSYGLQGGEAFRCAASARTVALKQKARDPDLSPLLPAALLSPHLAKSSWKPKGKAAPVRTTVGLGPGAPGSPEQPKDGCGAPVESNRPLETVHASDFMTGRETRFPALSLLNMVPK